MEKFHQSPRDIARQANLENIVARLESGTILKYGETKLLSSRQVDRRREELRRLESAINYGRAARRRY